MSKTSHKIIALSSLAILLIISISIITKEFELFGRKSIGNSAALGISMKTIQEKIEVKNSDELLIEEIATDIEIPWEVVFLSDNSLLVTERPGNLLHIQPDRQQKIKISGVHHIGEGGLLGLALHPEYEENNFIYLYLTTKTNQGLNNRVERYKFDEESNTISDRQTIIENIPGASYHDGGRIAFGPDNLLYITTGDSGEPRLAQDTNSLAGKIIRLTADGDIPEDNPFNNEIYSYGHRNSQGIDWDKDGNLWSSEHGPSLLSSGFDEVNIIEKGNNYGWPVIQGDEQEPGMETPLLQSGSSDTWAPAGLTVSGNTVFFTGLKGESLYSAEINNGILVKFKKHFQGDFGRLRAVKVSPDEQWLYISTSNTDKRGDVKENDDKIIRIKLSSLIDN